MRKINSIQIMPEHAFVPRFEARQLKEFDRAYAAWARRRGYRPPIRNRMQKEMDARNDNRGTTEFSD